jgi:hypothetical protein
LTDWNGDIAMNKLLPTAGFCWLIDTLSAMLQSSSKRCKPRAFPNEEDKHRLTKPIAIAVASHALGSTRCGQGKTRFGLIIVIYRTHQNRSQWVCKVHI